MGRVSLCLVIMFFICSAQKIDAQVQNIREKQDTISATKSLEHIRPENIKKGPLNNALDVLSGQSAGVNVTTNGTDRLAMLNSIRVRGTTSEKSCLRKDNFLMFWRLILVIRCFLCYNI